MKRFWYVVVLVLLLTTALGVLVGCNNKNYYTQYFNNFTSQDGFTQAVSVSALSENVMIDSYDSVNDVFITKMEVYTGHEKEGEKSVLFGFASFTKEYQSPRYAYVMAVNGDYAIVTKPGLKTEGNEVVMTTYIGVVKYRGGNERELTNFLVEYTAVYQQFRFVGEYLACQGLKELPSYVYNFTTFYDYKSQNQLLEVFRVRCDYKYDFLQYDDYLVGIGQDHAYFYTVTNIDPLGFLKLTDYDFYRGFPEDVSRKYAENISLQIFYIGNGWFLRSARIESDVEFEGWSFFYEQFDVATGETKRYYALLRSDKFNVKSKASAGVEALLVDGVANRYNRNEYQNLTDYFNAITTTSEDGSRYEYAVPVLNPAAMIKDGYSIVYTYWFPEGGNGRYEISFCLMNEKAEIIRLEEILMPLAFIDGVGIQNVDPAFESLYGHLRYTELSKKTKILKSYVEKERTYETYFAHDGVVVATELNLVEYTVLFGAVDVNGRQVLPFVYEELSPFYGGYAVGSRFVEKVLKTFSIDKNGNEIELKNVVAVKQGSVVVQDYGKYGLISYEGKVLLEAKYDIIEVFDVFMNNGTLQSSFAVAILGNQTFLFELA